MYKQVLQGQEPHKIQLMLALFSNLAKVDMAKKVPLVSYEKMLPFGLIFVCFFVCLFQGYDDSTFAWRIESVFTEFPRY